MFFGLFKSREEKFMFGTIWLGWKTENPFCSDWDRKFYTVTMLDYKDGWVKFQRNNKGEVDSLEYDVFLNMYSQKVD